MKVEDYPYELETRVAIIGTSLRVPGADSMNQFWELLLSGNSALQRFNIPDLQSSGLDDSLLQDSNFVPVHGYLGEIDRFDAQLFGYSPKEAELMDPQQRILLQLAWHSLESAGIDPNRTDYRIGTFTGVGSNQYAQKLIYPNSERFRGIQGHSLMLGNEKDFSASRVAYKLNLNGPAINIQSACSTGLAAVHTASQQLLSLECDVAVAGACSLQIPQLSGYLYNEGGILSKSGHCKPFDLTADGTVGGSGGVVVVMKRLDDAIRDRDTIHGIIAGSAVNNDGAQKAGFTAPSVGGHISVINEALKIAQLDPSQIEFIEAHGTGTEVGDPIELTALDHVYGKDHQNGDSCFVGAVKAVTGHLDTASGLVGLIKAMLALKNRTMPGNHYFKELNPRYDLNGSRLKIDQKNRPWHTNKEIRRAAVSSLGMGGTNVHLLLEEPPSFASKESSSDSLMPQILPFSAANPAALEAVKKEIDEVCNTPENNLGDIAYTLQEGRKELDWRMIAIRDHKGEVSVFKPQKVDREKKASVKNVFLFPGQGSQYNGMGSELYHSHPLFKRLCDELIQLSDEVVSDIGYQFFSKGILPKSVAESQVCIYLLQRALTQFWQEIGISPDIVLGHSLGEYAAAVTSGALDELHAINTIYQRGLLIDSSPEGAMLTILSDWETVSSLTDVKCELAALNAPGIITISGSIAEVERMESILDKHGITSVRLQSSRAFHSKVLQKIAGPFSKQIEQIQMSTPTLPWISTYTGSQITASDPQYWIYQMLQPVQFQKACTYFNEDNRYRFIEIGAGSQLSGLIRRNLPFIKKSDIHHSLDESIPEWRALLNGVAHCWISGESMRWQALYPNHEARKVSLPGYPFANTSFWLPEPALGTQNGSLKEDKNQEVRSNLPKNWIHRTTFERSKPIHLNSKPLSIPVFLISNDAFGDSLEGVLNCKKRSRFSDAADVITHFPDSMMEDKIHIVFYLGMEDTTEELYHINRLMSAIVASENSERFLVTVLCTEGVEITGEESVQPLGAAAAAYLRDLHIKIGRLSLHYVDVQKSHRPKQIANFVSESELNTNPKEGYQEFFYRGSYRWNRVFHPHSNSPENSDIDKKDEILPGDLCLITGGTGALGLHLASWLQGRNCDIILLTRRPAEKFTSDENEKINDIKTKGAKIFLIQADITRLEDLKRIKESIQRQFERPVKHLFHLAGSVSKTAWNHQTRDEFISPFEVKCTGLKNMLDQFDSEGLKSITLYSSLSVYTGGFAGPAYSASCAMMDNTASKYVSTEKLRTLNWGGWKEGGMAVKLVQKNGLSDSQIEYLSKDAFSSDDGRQLLDRIMTLKPQSMIISKRDVNRLIHESSKDFRRSKNGSEGFSEERYQRPDIGVEFIKPSNDTESKLASIWQDALGLEKIGSDDNFFDLGADSMMMIHVTEEINRSFQDSISKTDLFEFTTVRKLAEHLTKNGNASSDPEKQNLKSRTDKKKQAAAQQAKRVLELRRQRNRE